LQGYQFVPFDIQNDKICIAIVDPYNYNAIQAIKFVLRDKGVDFKLFLTTRNDLNSVFNAFQNISEEVKKSLSELDEEKLKKKGDDLIEEVKPDKEDVEVAPIIKIVSVILKNAVEGGASDIHIEGISKGVRVRFRVDGILHNTLTIPKDVYPAVVARIKILSNLKIDETRRPQDGRFSILENQKKIDFRVSTFPTEFGEKVVLRILDTSKGIATIDKLGFIGPKASIIKKSVDKPFGMVLVTGPTGSGKSTTLYTLLNMVNDEEINIVTLEDPVEYFMDGINQSQVRTEIGYSFASGLRSILRQDPDIIMVGEIRDGETASLAVQSALTGHLVFSTLHTNDAPGSIPRLIDMGVESFLLGSSLELIIAQRLVRTLCDKCKKQVKIDSGVKEYITKALSNLDPSYISKYYKGDFDSLYEPVGCSSCKNGFKGRTVIFEIVQISEELQYIIEKNQGEDKIRENLAQNNFVSLKQDGIFKVLNGRTSLQELLNTVDI